MTVEPWPWSWDTCRCSLWPRYWCQGFQFLHVDYRWRIVVHGMEFWSYDLWHCSHDCDLGNFIDDPVSKVLMPMWADYTSRIPMRDRCATCTMGWNFGSVTFDFGAMTLTLVVWLTLGVSVGDRSTPRRTLADQVLSYLPDFSEFVGAYIMLLWYICFRSIRYGNFSLVTHNTRYEDNRILLMCWCLYWVARSLRSKR